MDLNLRQRQKGLQDKIPDIDKTLNVVNFLLDRKLKVPFPLIPYRSVLSGS